MKLNRRIIKLAAGLASLCLCTILGVDLYINTVSNRFMYATLKEMPVFETGLLLGTSKYRINGTSNPFFVYRIDAAAKLYHNGIIKKIIASGDNRDNSYNEPLFMLNELVKQGVPRSAVILDRAGLSTFDSVVRCNRQFKQNNFLVISQKFQVQRALYIAHSYNITARGYAAKDVKDVRGLKTYFREYFARVKAFVDVWILHRNLP